MRLPTAALSPACAVLLCCLAACSATLYQQSDWSRLAWAGTEPCSAAKELTVACTPGMQTVGTELTCRATAGTLTIVLCDPTGIERHHEVLGGGEQHATLSWPAREGTWRLQVTAEQFAGSYDLTLAGTSRPIDVQVELGAGAGR